MLGGNDRAQVPDPGRIVRGTVGWVDDGGTPVDIGTSSNDGVTLIRVTLFRGRVPNAPLDQTQAQGQEVLCQLSSVVNFIPPRGAQVLVALPEGQSLIPGSGVLLAVIQPNPTAQFKASRAVIDVGPNTDLVIRGRSVVIEDWNSNPRYIAVGPPPSGGAAGIMICDETGSGFTTQSGAIGLFSASGGDVKSVIQLTTSGEIDIVSKSISGQAGAKFTGGNSTYFGNNWFGQHAGFYFGPVVSNPSPPYMVPPFPLFYANNGVPTPSLILWTQS